MTPDYQYCVLECTGKYKHVQGSEMCSCADGYEKKTLETGGHECVSKCPAGQAAEGDRCVSIKQCVLEGNIVAGDEDGHVRICTTREHWLAMSRKNYVRFIYGGTYGREITQSDSADDVCAEGQSTGLIFVEDRICSCALEKYYQANDGKCALLPDKLDKDHLLFDLHYTYNGRQFVSHTLLLTYKQCTEEAGNEIGA